MMSGTFPPSTPQSLQNTIPSRLYQQYTDDDTLQAFVAAYNQLAQEYVDWFNQINLPVYTGLTGSLLDWVAAGLYGLVRPVIASQSVVQKGLFNTYRLNELQMDQSKTFTSQNIYVATDDVYKRVLTWLFYKGDGFQFNIRWLKRRVMRFLVGLNGAGYAAGTQIINGVSMPANLEDNRNTTATYFNAANQLKVAAANTPRVSYRGSVPSLLVENSGTNYVRNPLGIGGTSGTIGSGGVLPTYWSWSLGPTLTCTLTVSTSQNGIGSIDVRIHGTPTGAQAVLSFDSSGVSVASGQFLGFSFYVTLTAGSVAGIASIVPEIGYTASASDGLDFSGAPFNVLQRPKTTTNAQVTGLAYPQMRITFVQPFAPVDLTFRIGGVQFEEEPVSSLILPPSGTTAVSTRAADIISYPTTIDNTYPVSVSFTSPTAVKITITGSQYAAMKAILSAAIASGVLPLPFQYTYTVA